MKSLADFRQLLYPREFRIPGPNFDLRQMLRVASVGEQIGPNKDAQKTDGLSLKQQAKMIAELGTELWRLRRRMTDEVSGEPKDEMRKPFRHVAAAWEILADIGVKIQDHTGQPFRSGPSIEAAAFQPTAGLLSETIIETVRPSIYFKDEQVQRGQVIVGTPEE